MGSRKRQEDKHLKILRDLVTQPLNKKCFDCGQRGPTYVNMTIGAFVCTSCSGLLRGLNPPHRIKSISMASFSPQDLEFLQAHGNEVCRSTWLGLWESPAPAEPESKEEQKVKDFLTRKYERKVWYTSKPKLKAAEPEAKPLKTLIGENTPAIVVGSKQEQKAASTIRPPHGTTPQQPTVAAITKQEKKSNMDLLGDLGSDPFGTSAPAPASSNQGADAFGMYAQPPPPQNQQQQPLFDAFGSGTQTQQPSQPPNSFDFFASSSTAQSSSAATTDFFSSSVGASSSSGFGSTTTSSTAGQPSSGDKYAALADLSAGSTSVFGGGDQSVFGSSGGNNQSVFGSTSNSASTNGSIFGSTVTSSGGGQSIFGSSSGGNSTGQSIFGSSNNMTNTTTNTSNANNVLFMNQHQQQQNPFMTSASMPQQQQQQQFKSQNPFQVNHTGSGAGMFGGPIVNGGGIPQQNPMNSNSNSWGASSTGMNTMASTSMFPNPQQQPQQQQQAFNNMNFNNQTNFNAGFEQQQQQQQQQPNMFGNNPQQQNFGNFGQTQQGNMGATKPFGGIQMPGFGQFPQQQQQQKQQQSFGTWGQSQPQQQSIKSNNPFM